MFLQCLPLVSDVWDCVDAQSEPIRQSYWKTATIPWEIPEGRLSYFVRNLIHSARGDRAVELLARQNKEIPEEIADSVFDALEALPLAERESEETDQDNLRWEIQRLFEVLYKIGMSQVERLVRLELLYHEVFENGEAQLFQPMGLLAAIRESPSLFVDLLSYPWKDDTGESTTPDDDSTKVLANRVQNLLHNLAELPGQSDLCPMDHKTTVEWVADVIRVATERRYVTALQLQLPPVLACRAWHAIDSWPSPEIVEVINAVAELDPESIRQQLSSSLFNARGVHWVDPTGQTEKCQAEELRLRANQIRQTCPTAAWALRDIANGLDSDATRNVERAK